MLRTALLSYLIFLFQPCFSQTDIDSSKTLDEVTIRAFEQNRKLSSAVTNVKILDLSNSDRNNKTSLVSGFNTIAGVRMEERSPGSYRINMRGSSLRSPFGVRNVKVYWNNIPVTDPGGNTYFNQFAINNFSHIEIFKGPAGSMYGAGTGGLILMENFDSWQPGISLEYLTGTYNLQNIFTAARFGKTNSMNQVTFAHNQTDGYRDQSRLRRDNFSWISKLKISERQEFSANLLFTDMYYQTPGALTLAEFTNNPKAARPAAGPFPSSEDAHAAIKQVNFLLGINHRYKILSSLSNITTFYGAYNMIKNPAVRNYERRTEPGFGGRTVFSFDKYGRGYALQLVAGSEFQHGIFNTLVLDNENGNPGALQTNDDIVNTIKSYFIQGDISIKGKWMINSGISLTKTNVSFTRYTDVPVLNQNRSYQNELAPRLSVKRILSSHFSAKATVSRGFSPPTISELLPSTGVISTNLEAESGWNYEGTISFFKQRGSNRVDLEATAFYFKLNNALVQRRDSSGADYFVNAGDTKQKGIELSGNYRHHGTMSSLIDYLNFRADFTYNHFRYGSFIKGTSDFSGKTLPSVPSNILSVIADLQLKKGMYINLSYYSASSIFLNDANTASARAYHLLGGRIGYQSGSPKFPLNFYVGADNLLDEIYSLGNDINAAANRFYNTAARRNYYVGIAIQWNRTPKNQ